VSLTHSEWVVSISQQLFSFLCTLFFWRNPIPRVEESEELLSSSLYGLQNFENIDACFGKYYYDKVFFQTGLKESSST
jgi:hypothetical protein